MWGRAPRGGPTRSSYGKGPGAVSRIAVSDDEQLRTVREKDKLVLCRLVEQMLALTSEEYLVCTNADDLATELEQTIKDNQGVLHKVIEHRQAEKAALMRRSRNGGNFGLSTQGTDSQKTKQKFSNQQHDKKVRDARRHESNSKKLPCLGASTGSISRSNNKPIRPSTRCINFGANHAKASRKFNGKETEEKSTRLPRVVRGNHDKKSARIPRQRTPTPPSLSTSDSKKEDRSGETSDGEDLDFLSDSDEQDSIQDRLDAAQRNPPTPRKEDTFKKLGQAYDGNEDDNDDEEEEEEDDEGAELVIGTGKRDLSGKKPVTNQLKGDDWSDDEDGTMDYESRLAEERIREQKLEIERLRKEKEQERHQRTVSAPNNNTAGKTNEEEMENDQDNSDEEDYGDESYDEESFPPESPVSLVETTSKSARVKATALSASVSSQDEEKSEQASTPSSLCPVDSPKSPMSPMSLPPINSPKSAQSKKAPMRDAPPQENKSRFALLSDSSGDGGDEEDLFAAFDDAIDFGGKPLDSPS